MNGNEILNEDEKELFELILQKSVWHVLDEGENKLFESFCERLTPRVLDILKNCTNAFVCGQQHRVVGFKAGRQVSRLKDRAVFCRLWVHFESGPKMCCNLYRASIPLTLLLEEKDEMLHTHRVYYEVYNGIDD